jgi:hypothetical protein
LTDMSRSKRRSKKGPSAAGGPDDASTMAASASPAAANVPGGAAGRTKFTPRQGGGTGRAPSGVRTQNPSRGGSLMGGSVPGAAYVGLNDRAPSWDGGIITTFPFFNPVESNEVDIIQMETSSLWQFGATAGGQHSFGTQETNNWQANYNWMLDNLAREYVNAQNLTLTTQSDFALYINTYAAAASPLFAVVSLFNADGFNQRLSSLAQAATQNRARAQAAMERLQQFPIPPGVLDFIEMYSGIFGTIPGGSVIMNYSLNGGTNGQPTDLTSLAGSSTLLTQAETAITQLGTNSESNLARLVIAEYFGDPLPLPFPGVKMSRGLYDLMRLRSMQFRGATNYFTFPFLQAGSTSTTIDATVPLIIPRGMENWPIWSSLYIPHALGNTNNVVLASLNQEFGLLQDSGSATTGFRSYPKGGVGSSLVTLALPISSFPYNSPFGDYYWAAMTGNSEVGYSNDVRGSVDVAKFYVSFSLRAQNSMRIADDILQGKKRVPQMPDRAADYSIQHVASRGRVRYH